MAQLPDFYYKLSARIQEKFPLLQILLGPRQVGKTTAAKNIYDQFNGSKIFVSADGPTPPDFEWLSTHWHRARALPAPVLLIVDEIQKITGWSEIVKREFDQDRGKTDLRVILLGSSTMLLQRGLSESLAGRFELLHAHHWNFGEMEQVFKWDLETYLSFGGYPGAAQFISDTTRWQSYLKESIIEPVLGRDILTASSVSKPALFRQAFEVAMSYPAQEVSYQKIVGQLQEQGSGETVKHYLGLFESAFLIKSVLQYSTRPLSTRTSSPKLVPLAPALIHAFSPPQRVALDSDWRGRVFEAVVGAALARQERLLFTWRAKNAEVDYIVPRSSGLIAVEVKSGRRRTSKGLEEFLRKFSQARPVVITPESALPLLRGEPIDSYL
jgi:predicted AAA+ superfamily ATPase